MWSRRNEKNNRNGPLNLAFRGLFLFWVARSPSVQKVGIIGTVKKGEDFYSMGVPVDEKRKKKFSPSALQGEQIMVW